MLLRPLRDVVSRAAAPRAVGVARAVVGIAAILKILERAPVLQRLNDPDIVRVPYFAGQPSLADLPAELVLVIWAALAATFMVGACTTASGAALTAFLAAVLLSDQQLYSNHLYLLIWLVGLLTLARSGAALSVDAWRGRGRASVPAWPIALIRLQVIILYLFAGLSKINLTYLSGSVVATSLRDDGFLAIPGEWRSFELMAALAALSILTELGLAAGLLLPHWRRTAFVVGLGLHGGIALFFDPTLPLVVFAVIALAPYVLFLDGRSERLDVVWDDSCTFCRGWARWFRRLDWLGVLRLVPNSDAAELERLGVTRGEADRALQLVGGDGRSQGFGAVIGIMESLPISFLWAPLLRLWPIRRLGDATYRRVAERRSCGLTPPPG